MAKTYDNIEIGQKISTLLKILLFRDNSETVLTETSEITSLRNGDNISNVKIQSKNESIKQVKKKNIKQHSMEVEKEFSSFNEK